MGLQPDSLTGTEERALTKWLDIQPEAHPIAMAAALRNVVRHAEAYGPKLVAKLFLAGFLEPGDDPEFALDTLIDKLKETR